MAEGTDWLLSPCHGTPGYILPARKTDGSHYPIFKGFMRLDVLSTGN